MRRKNRKLTSVRTLFAGLHGEKKPKKPKAARCAYCGATVRNTDYLDMPEALCRKCERGLQKDADLDGLKGLGALKLKRYRPGLYAHTAGGATYFVQHNEEWTPGMRWGWRSENGDFNDVFPTKQEAMLALEEHLQSKGLKGLPTRSRLGAVPKFPGFKFRLSKRQEGAYTKFTASVYAPDERKVGEVSAKGYTQGCGEALIAEGEITDRAMQGKGLYPAMLTKLRDFVQRNGCTGIASIGVDRNEMSEASWQKFAAREPRVTADNCHYHFRGLPTRGRIPLATAKRALKNLPKKYRSCGITPSLLREGMEIEREHRDVTRGRVGDTAKTAAVHICEHGPKYYPSLKKLERKLKR